MFATQVTCLSWCLLLRLEIIVFEPSLREKSFFNSLVIDDLDSFKERSEIIISNRLSSELDDVKDKVFTRDLFNID